MRHSNTNILLINPRWTGIRRQRQPQFKRVWPPLELANAGALLEARGHRVTIVDNNVAGLCARRIGELSRTCDRVFVTTSPYDRWQCPALDISFFFDTIRHIPPERLYIMGAHVTERPRALLLKTRARAAVLHEPEATICDIAGRDNRPPAAVADRIPGIAYLQAGRLHRTPARGFAADWDRWPLPAFHLLPMDRYAYELMGTRFTVLEGSRGCPHSCTFCYLGMFGRRYRPKSAERLVAEVHAVRREHGVRNVYFMDLEFGLQRNRVRDICRALIGAQTGVNWCCQTRVVDLDPGLLGAMRAAGCSLIHLGVESGSDRILAATGKGIRVADAQEAVRAIHAAGIRTAVFMNFGFPGETVQEMRATIDLALRLDPTYAAFHLIVPFPGTPLARQIHLDPETLPAHHYPHYNFRHHDLKTLKRILRTAYLRFYLRPRYCARLLGRGGRIDLRGIKTLLGGLVS